MYRQDASPDRTILVTTFNSRVFGIDRATGDIRWSVVRELGDDQIYEIAIEGDVVIAASSTNIGFIDYRSGTVHAIVPIGGMARRPLMVVDGGFVYLSTSGELVCFTTRGQVVWKQGFKGHGYGPMALGLPGNIRQADDNGKA